MSKYFLIFFFFFYEACFLITISAQLYDLDILGAYS